MRWTIPNILTLLRIALIPVFMIAYYLPVGWSHVVTTAIFGFAAITDWFDGYLARRVFPWRAALMARRFQPDLIYSWLMQSALAGAGMVGPLSQSLAVVVTLGISQAFSTSGQYAGVSPTVAVGADISKVTVANGPSLIGILNANLSAVLGPGPALGFMTTGLGMGIASLLLQGTGAGPVTGTPVVPPVASGGVTNSVVV